MNKEGIKTILQEILNKLTVTVDDISVIENESGVVFMIQTNEADLLIGTNGANLIALNHIVKRLVEKKELAENKNFTIDVNNYQKQRNENLVTRVKVIADKVKEFKVDVEMDPMTSYERMIVHSILADDPEILTESSGVGRDRKIVIKYKKNEV